MDRHPALSFEEYLEAKRRVDLRCLNRHVLGAFRKKIESVCDPVLFDMGTGTGLMIRKLLSMPLQGDAHIVGVDLSVESCCDAVDLVKVDLTRCGYQDIRERVSRAEHAFHTEIQAQNKQCSLSIELKAGNVLDPHATWQSWDHELDAVTANAFLDLMPLHDIVALVKRMLKPEGLFYTTINYDGMTTLLPLYADGAFEAELLACYDHSMERRRCFGKRTGGCRTGSRLFGVLINQGFNIVSWGSSDWTIVPRNGRYRPGEKDFVRAIVHMIHREGVNCDTFPSERLKDWLSDRLKALDDGGLSFMNHQIDALAQKV